MIVGSGWLRSTRRSEEGWPKRKHHLSRSLFYDELNWFNQPTSLVCLLCSSLLPCGETLASAMQQGENFQSTVTVHEPEGSSALNPSSSLVHTTGTPPALIPLLPDIPLCRHSPSRGLFPGFIASPTPKKWDHFSGGSLGNHCYKRTHISSPEVEVRSEHSSAWGDKNIPNWCWRLDAALNNEGRKLPVPPPVQLGLPLIWKME